jgi:hypothetical protein
MTARDDPRVPKLRCGSACCLVMVVRCEGNGQGRSEVELEARWKERVSDTTYRSPTPGGAEQTAQRAWRWIRRAPSAQTARLPRPLLDSQAANR